MKKPIPGLTIHTPTVMLTPSTAAQPATEPDAQNQNCRVAPANDDAPTGTLLAQTAVEALVSSGLVHTAISHAAQSAAPAVSSALRFALRLARRGF